MKGKKVRVLIAKPGLDGHDRGAKVVARALRDAGMEVIYTGLRQTPEQIVETAIHILSGAHTHLFPKIMEILKENDIKDIIVMGGGVIPEEDIPELKKVGIAEIFTPGTDTRDIIKFVKEKIK